MLLYNIAFYNITLYNITSLYYEAINASFHTVISNLFCQTAFQIYYLHALRYLIKVMFVAALVMQDSH